MSVTHVALIVWFGYTPQVPVGPADWRRNGGGGNLPRKSAYISRRLHVLDRVLKASLAILVGGAVGLVALHAQAPAKQWKDRGEYDLYDSATKEQDLKKSLALLNP